MDHPAYTLPVARLLTYGEIASDTSFDSLRAPWIDYVTTFGLTAADIPELIRLATDRKLFERLAQEDEAPAETDSTMWAPVHAWRALGQLHAHEAVAALIGIIGWDSDWVRLDLARVFALIGPVAIPSLITALGETTLYDMFDRLIAADAIGLIGKDYPDAREQCVAALVKQLEAYADQDEDFNGFLIINLVQLDAGEAAPTIEQAFMAEKVNEMISGDWEDVQVELHLIEPPPGYMSPEERAEMFTDDLRKNFTFDADGNIEPVRIRELGMGASFPYVGAESPFPRTPQSHSAASLPKHKKDKQKMAKASRKKNRKKS